MGFADAGAPSGPARSAAGRPAPPAPPPPPARRDGGRRHGRWRAALVRCASAAALLAAASAAVLAADNDPEPPPPAPAQPPAAAAQPPAAPPAARERIPDGAALRLLGRDVKGPSGEVVAQVVNVLVDASGRPLAAVLDYGGFMGVGRRRIAVAWRALSFAPGGTPGPAGGGAIALSLSRDQLKNIPDHKDGEPVVVAAPPTEGGGSAPAPVDDGPAAAAAATAAPK